MNPPTSAALDLDPLGLTAQSALRQVRDHAIFLIDLHGRIRSWNEGVGLILGWSEDGWLGKPANLAFTSEDVASGVPEAEMRQARDAGHADDGRWMQRQGGERFFAAGSLARLLDAGGRLVGYLKVLHDSSAFKQAEQELERLVAKQLEREQALRALVEGIRDYAIYTLTPQGRISSWHQGAASMKGYTPEEAIGMPFGQLFTPEERVDGLPEREMALAARDGEYQGEGTRLRKDGSTFDAAVVLTALRDAEGELLGFVKLTQDITERRHRQRQLEEALHDAQHARADAERASHLKGEFLATISHELRTPLSAILGWAHLLERGNGSDPAMLGKGLSAISRNARVQVQLIDDLLDMNRIESGQLRLDLQHLDLGALALTTVESMLPGANAKNIALRCTADETLGLVVGDPGRLQQVVGKLIGNAIKFTSPGGRVAVNLLRDGEGARITVDDDGQGIEPEFLTQVFDRFQQQDATTTRRHGGLGIGLAVVRHLVHAHGGSVWAESAGGGQGARFTVLLPLTGAAATPTGDRPAASPLPATPAAPAQPRALQRLDGTTVLLVDDEPDLRAMTEQVLREAGAVVRAVASADEGIAALQWQRPDVILCDIGMPVHDGHDFLRRARLLPGGADIPAAAFTAYVRPEDRQRSHEAGFRLHLAKPVLPAALVDAVAELRALLPRR